MPPPVFQLPATHRRRLREMWRSAGWPYQDLIEVELLAAGLLARQQDASGRETLRVTDAGLQVLAQTLQRNRATRDPHEALVARVALEMQRAGRVVWRGLALRVALPAARAGTEEASGLASEADEGQQREEREEREEADDRALSRALSSEPRDLAPPKGSAAQSSPLFTGSLPAAEAPPPATRWAMAVPDVFSIRHTTREDLVEPIVHEIKVRRADLLSDLRSADKRAAYLALSSQCWYVLKAGIADPDEVPLECGVMVAHLRATAASSAPGPVLEVLRPAPRRRHRIAFATWVALARATPDPLPDEGPQDLF